MKLAIVGSREFPDEDFAKTEIIKILSKGNVHILVSGGAKGIDTLAEKGVDIVKEIYKIDIEKEIYHANWSKHGKSAGYMRNKDIVANSDKVVAFWDGASRGTKHSIDLAIKAKKPIDIYIR